VATSTGPVAIESIRIGNDVWAYDLVASQWRLCRVLQTFVSDYQGHLVFLRVGGETIESTSGHPFWVVRGEDLTSRRCPDHAQPPKGATTLGRWVQASDLRAGDDVLLRDGRIVALEAMRLEPFTGKVYNFTVAELESYAVGLNNVLVHNVAGDCFGPGGGHFVDDWQLSDENGNIVAQSDDDGVWSGNDRSLDPGEQPTWDEQAAETHTEGKVITGLEEDGMLESGRTLEMSGYKDPCNPCQRYMLSKSAQYQMNISYTNEYNQIWACSNGAWVARAL
jgi:hypothetical protein